VKENNVFLSIRYKLTFLVFSPSNKLLLRTPSNDIFLAFWCTKKEMN